MTNRPRTPIEGIVRATNTAQADAFLAWLRRMAVATDADSGNIVFTLGEKEGQTAFTVEDSAHVAQFTLDSDGNLTVKTIAAPTSVWQLGEFVPTASPYVEAIANYTVTTGDETIEYTSGSYTLTLLSAGTVPNKVYNIKNSGNGVITIATTSGETIDGNASGVLKLVQYDNLTVQSNAKNWLIL